MIIMETNNEDQYEVHSDEGSTEVIIDVMVNRKRFTRLKELHLSKYCSDETFWIMFERDLFDTEK